LGPNNRAMEAMIKQLEIIMNLFCFIKGDKNFS